jgi:hypothetical protein
MDTGTLSVALIHYNGATMASVMPVIVSLLTVVSVSATASRERSSSSSSSSSSAALKNAVVPTSALDALSFYDDGSAGLSPTRPGAPLAYGGRVLDLASLNTGLWAAANATVPEVPFNQGCVLRSRVIALHHTRMSLTACSNVSYCTVDKQYARARRTKQSRCSSQCAAGSHTA